MRLPTYLSYSAFSQFEKDREEFYLKYLSPTRAPRLPQERPASIGSAFDAYVKASLFAELGLPADQRYEFESLFEAQVEEHNRDWARVEGEYVFDCYKFSGAYAVLLDLLRRSIEPPRFEFDVRTTIETHGQQVPFLGKPDCRYVLQTNQGELRVVHDWKVNGYCSKSATSPTKGYMLCMDGYTSAKPSQSHGKAHKQYVEVVVPVISHDQPDMKLSKDQGALEDCSPSWADQLSLYGWALGEPVGDSKVLLSIDQVVAKPQPEGRPLLRVASYRAHVRQSYQEHLAQRLADCWDVICSGYIFRYLSQEDSDTRCKLLDQQAASLHGEDDWFGEVVRPKYRG